MKILSVDADSPALRAGLEPGDEILSIDGHALSDILDLRYYKTSLRAYIEDNAIDNILVCYNVKNFATDGNIFLMQY